MKKGEIYTCVKEYRVFFTKGKDYTAINNMDFIDDRGNPHSVYGEWFKEHFTLKPTTPKLAIQVSNKREFEAVNKWEGVEWVRGYDHSFQVVATGEHGNMWFYQAAVDDNYKILTFQEFQLLTGVVVQKEPIVINNGTFECHVDSNGVDFKFCSDNYPVSYLTREDIEKIHAAFKELE